MDLSVRWYKTYRRFPRDDGERVVRMIMMTDGHELPPLGCSCQGLLWFFRGTFLLLQDGGAGTAGMRHVLHSLRILIGLLECPWGKDREGALAQKPHSTHLLRDTMVSSTTLHLGAAKNPVLVRCRTSYDMVWRTCPGVRNWTSL